MRKWAVFFLILIPVSCRLKQRYSLWSGTKVTLWKFLGLAVWRTCLMCRRILQKGRNNEDFKLGASHWCTEGDGSMFYLRWNILCFKKPLMHPLTHFHCIHILWVFFHLLCACQTFFGDFKKFQTEVIISSSQSFRQNGDTIVFHLNESEDAWKMLLFLNL